MPTLEEELLAAVEAKRQQRMEPPVIDIEEAERHLALNGIGPTDPVILCAFGKTNRYVPDRGHGAYDWTAVTEEAAKGKRDYEALRLHLTNVDRKTLNLGYISCPGGTATKKRDEIKEGRVVFAEVDLEGLSKDYQANLWKLAELPEPTYELDTGNKSIWPCWVLKEMVSAAEIRRLRQGVSQAIEDASGLKTDHSLHSPHQPARLAGGIHPKSGQRSRLINVTGKRYSAEELMAACPPIQEKVTGQGRGNLFRPDEEGDSNAVGSYPEPSQLTAAVPLEVALSKITRAKIQDGQPPGEKTGRAITAYRLSQSLQAAEAQLLELGYSVEGSPLELFEAFCINSDLLGLQRLEDCRIRHYADPSEMGCGELSKAALQRAITDWAESAGHWSYEFKGFGKSNKPQPVAVQALPLEERTEQFEAYLASAIERHKNPFRRLVFIRAKIRELGLSNEVKEKDLPELILKAQQQLQGGGFRALSAADRAAMKELKIEWLVRDVVPANDLTFIGGRPKVGKTVLVVDLLRAVLNGEPWLGFETCGQGRAVVFVTDDQSDADTKSMLEAQGIWSHPDLWWVPSFRLCDEHMQQLLEIIKTNPGCVVVVDSLRSITRGMVTGENDPALGVALYDVKGAVMAAGGTLLMIHHCSKSENAVGTEALSGHNSIPGSANSIVTLHHLPKAEGGGVQKGIPARRLYREGRSGGLTPDLLVAIGEGGRFSKEGNFEEFSEKQREIKRSHSIQKQPEYIKKAFRQLVELHNTEKAGISTLQLLKLAGGCDQSVVTKKDLGTSGPAASNHRKLERELDKYAKSGTVQRELLRGKFSGAASMHIWSLSDAGAMEFRAALS